MPSKKINWWKILRRAAALLALTVIALLVAVRVFGLPRAVDERIQRELRAHGLFVQAEQLYVDFLGRVQARRIFIAKTDEVSVSAGGSGIEGSVLVEKAQVRFNWLSWWRGEPFLRGATLSRADIVFQLDKETSIRIEDVSADVNLRAKDVEVRYLRGRWQHLRVDVAGVIDFSGGAHAAGGQGERQRPDLARLAGTYRRVEEIAGRWTARQPLTLSGQFQVPLANPLGGTAKVQLAGVDQWWQGARVARVNVSADYAAEVAKLDGTVELSRGKLVLNGECSLAKSGAEVNFYADADLSLLAEIFPEGAAEKLRVLKFQQLPVNQGSARVAWGEALTFIVTAKSEWRDFSIGEQQFDSFESAFSYDGKRFMVSGLRVTGPAGTLTAELFHDGESKVRGRADCAIDPRAFRALCGAGAQPFFNSLEFKTPPRITATVSGSGFGAEQLTVSGSASVADFSYKGVPVVSAGSEFDFHNHELHLAKLRFKRAEGEGGGEIWDNFKTKQVRVKGVKATLNVQDTALILGSKMAEYMAPYRFVDTPTFSIDGHFDLNDEEQKFRTDMKARITSRKGAHYMFLKRDLLLADIDLGIAIKGQKMTLTPNKPLTLFDGKMDGSLTITLVRDTTYETRLKFSDNDFAAVMKTFFSNDKVTGRVSGSVDLRGAFADWKTMRGAGTLTVRDGELYNIPFLGGLSELLNSVIPDMGYAKASEAESKFTISDGVIQMQKLDINSLFFVLIGQGRYDFINDHIELDERANLRGAPGVATWLLSKMFEYHGSGPIAKTKWEAKNF